MKRLNIFLALITKDNDYQREQASVAEATARRLGIDLQVAYAANDALVQTKQILAAVHAAATERPDAVIVEPVGTGMLEAASAAARNGIGWIVLNREADYLLPLREKATAPVGSVQCNNTEVGRIQARQFAALLPTGGTVLYIEGPNQDAARQRRAGLEEFLPGTIKIQSSQGNWTEDSGTRLVSARLQRHGARPPDIGLIGCQNDAMAMGARKAIEGLPDVRQREQWLKIPLTGVDGVRATGQAWVQERLLAATVIIPALTGVALEILTKAIGTGTQIPERTLTDVTSYPPLDRLHPGAARV